MTGAEYRMHMDMVAHAARVLLVVPVQDLLDTVNHAETIGPIVNPTVMQECGFRNLSEQRQVLEAALALRTVASNLQPAQDGGS